MTKYIWKAEYKKYSILSLNNNTKNILFSSPLPFRSLLGIIIVLTVITIVFLLGLIGVSKSHFPTVLLFSCMDLFLLVITYYGSYTTRGANMGAFVIFLITTVLSFTYSSFIWRQSMAFKRSATTERLHHNHNHRHPDQSSSSAHSHQHNLQSLYDLYDDYESPTLTTVSYEQDINDFSPYNHYWTVESNESKRLVGDRYDVWVTTRTQLFWYLLDHKTYHFLNTFPKISRRTYHQFFWNYSLHEKGAKGKGCCIW